MARDWIQVFSAWAQGPSQTELDKCSNAESAIKKAIEASNALAGRDVNVFAQGSYKNRTNVKADSDVDICARCNSVYFTDYLDGITQQEVGLIDSSYAFRQFKDDVQTALQNFFGSSVVRRGNKAFNIHESRTRVDADVVPAFEYRSYFRFSGQIYHSTGIGILPDNGARIINYPEQHYQNGVKKNDETNRHFKRIVRIFKRLRNEMADRGISIAANVPSFLLECLVWNVPNAKFSPDSYKADLRESIIFLFNGTRDDASCSSWREVNDIKPLFGSTQKWNRQHVNEFMKAAWNYAEYEF